MGFNFLYTDRWAFNWGGGGGETYVCAVRVEGGEAL